jgi:hypothetical protein
LIIPKNYDTPCRQGIPPSNAVRPQPIQLLSDEP